MEQDKDKLHFVQTSITHNSNCFVEFIDALSVCPSRTNVNSNLDHITEALAKMEVDATALIAKEEALRDFNVLLAKLLRELSPDVKTVTGVSRGPERRRRQREPSFPDNSPSSLSDQMSRNQKPVRTPLTWSKRMGE